MSAAEPGPDLDHMFRLQRPDQGEQDLALDLPDAAGCPAAAVDVHIETADMILSREGAKRRRVQVELRGQGCERLVQRSFD
jgi:hypothetical protein